jgi:hypothetical protein
VAKASGSMMRAIAKGSLTGINRLDKNSTRPPPGKPVKPVILFVAAVIRAVRIYHEAAEIVEALTAGAVAGNPPPSGVGVTALLVEVSGAVKRGNRAAGVVQAGGVPEAAVAGPVAVAAAVAAAVVAAAVAAADDKD